MISWQRILYTLGLVLVEATPAALLATLLGRSMWLPLAGVVVAGALAEWLSARWLAPRRQRVVLAVLAVLAALWACKGQIGGGYGMLAGWERPLNALFGGATPLADRIYLLLLIALYAFWRGLRLPSHDSNSLRRHFTRTALAMLLLSGLGALSGGLTEQVRALATLQILVFFAVGLVVIALAAAAEEQDTHLRRLDWRAMLTLGTAVLSVLLLALLLAAWVSVDAAAALGAIWHRVLALLTLIFLPLLLVLLALLSWLLSGIDAARGLLLLDQREQLQQQLQQLQSEPLFGLPLWVGQAIEGLLALLPMLLLVMLVILVRRRRQQRINADEQRESLWSWGGALHDLRDLLAQLRRAGPADGGLRAALARLRGDDPATRVRRSYIRLLLAGESRDQPRGPAQTPQEYRATLAASLPAEAPAVELLTGAYERARYHPQAVTPSEAEQAEHSWRQIAPRRP